MKPLSWRNGRLVLLDQTALPAKETYVVCADHHMVGDMIRKLGVRGAPAIAAAAYGMVLAAQEASTREAAAFAAFLDRAEAELADTRPTAVNLFWALKRMAKARRGKPPPKLWRRWSGKPPPSAGKMRKAAAVLAKEAFLYCGNWMPPSRC